MLKTLSKENHIGGGSLKRWVDTRWHTMYDCVLSIINHKVILEMVSLKIEWFDFCYSFSFIL